ncbi:ABC transporter permease [Streptomyces sp. V4-01]|uniref:ABC transporter permease n=1 Tax=Actinacidiphila polyblastidii TaxID=3110430 RepID=A0ABU7PDJ0_9ACTN|nr:ABC transporter permease [Streptomyces sp. V4-01]
MRTFRLTWRLPIARAALTVLAAVAVLALFGHQLAPQDPLAQDSAHILRGPGGAHLLGTDYLGRDVLSRLLAGTGLTVAGALEAVGAAMALGIVPGLASLWLGRFFEWSALRAVDALMTMPFTLFAIAAVGVLGNGLHQAMLALGVLLSPLFFRVTRAAALGLRQAPYVEAAELMGASRSRVLRTHIWSKVLPTVAVTTAQALATSLLTVASLTFLGLGVQPPAPTWGGMLATDLGYLGQQPWAPVLPGALIMLTVGALHLLADAVRDSGGASAGFAGAPEGGTAAAAAATGTTVRPAAAADAGAADPATAEPTAVQDREGRTNARISA